MSKTISGVITWLKDWFDDIYAPKTHSHNNYITHTALESYVSEKIVYYEIQPLKFDSNDEPTIETSNFDIGDDAFAIRITSKDKDGNIIPNCSTEVKFSWNNNMTDYITTNSNGVFTTTVDTDYTYSLPTTWGLYEIQVGNDTKSINIKGSRLVNTSNFSCREYEDFIVLSSGSNASYQGIPLTQNNSTWVRSLGLGNSNINPKTSVFGVTSDPRVLVRVSSDGTVSLKNISGTAITDTTQLYFMLMWRK